MQSPPSPPCGIVSLSSGQVLGFWVLFYDIVFVVTFTISTESMAQHDECQSIRVSILGYTASVDIQFNSHLSKKLICICNPVIQVAHFVKSE